MKSFYLFLLAFTLWAVHGAYHAGQYLRVQTPFGVFSDQFPISPEAHFIIESVIGLALISGIILSYRPFMEHRKDRQVVDEFFNDSERNERNL